MLKQYFILGRNPSLSRQEIISYLEAREIKYAEIFCEENLLLIELDKKININELGGTLKSGMIEVSGDQNKVNEYIITNELVHENKFNYGMFGNLEPTVLKDKFKAEKRKAILKHGRTDLTFQNKKNIKIPKAPHYFILHTFKKKIYFGKINQEYDSNDVEYRDMNKPIRREHLAISPRLSKILINLSGAKEHDLLLDPFCGIGGICQEALLKHINVYGSDIDPEAIRDARINIKWLVNNYTIKNRFTIERKNARNLPERNFNAVATETPLGEVVTKKPNDKKSHEIVQKFERLIIPVLKRIKRVKEKKAKIAITFPKIRKVGVDINKICEETGLSLQIKPIVESREKQYISREIVVLT